MKAVEITRDEECDLILYKTKKKRKSFIMARGTFPAKANEKNKFADDFDQWGLF